MRAASVSCRRDPGCTPRIESWPRHSLDWRVPAMTTAPAGCWSDMAWWATPSSTMRRSASFPSTRSRSPSRRSAISAAPTATRRGASSAAAGRNMPEGAPGAVDLLVGGAAPGERVTSPSWAASRWPTGRCCGDHAAGRRAGARARGRAGFSITTNGTLLTAADARILRAAWLRGHRQPRWRGEVHDARGRSRAAGAARRIVEQPAAAPCAAAAHAGVGARHGDAAEPRSAPRRSTTSSGSDSTASASRRCWPRPRARARWTPGSRRPCWSR